VDVGGYSAPVKQIWTGRLVHSATKYGENVPTAAVCCNACRTCLTTNVVGLATGAIVAATVAVRRRIGRA
jgi:hypothetical protein